MGKTLKLFLINGDEFGPKTVTISNWSGIALYCPISNFNSDITSRYEFGSPGVYILKSISDSSIYNEKIYIGESENLKSRIKEHIKNEKMDFTEFVIFSNTGTNLTKGLIKYLESKLITLAKNANNCEIDMYNINQTTLPMLPESDISDMEEFLENIRLILPTLGYYFLKSNFVNKNSPLHKEIPLNLFRINNSKITAEMYIKPGVGYIITKNSLCKAEHTKYMGRSRISFKNKLIKEHKLTKDGDYYRFVEDTIFPSSSFAASLILGISASGPISWFEKNTNRSLKEIDEQI